MNDQLREERRELKDLQLKLSKYANLDESELDPNIRNLFDGEPPDWLTNSIIFSPVMSLFQNEINELAEEVRDKQRELRSLIRETKRATSPIPRDYDAEISRLNDNISSLNQFIQDFSLTDYSYGAYESGTQLPSMELEIMQLRQAEEDLNQEIAQLESDLRECIDELSKAQNTSEIYKEELEKSRKMMKEYRVTLQMLEQTAQDLNRNRKQLHQRGQALANVITKLQLNKGENEKRIRKLEEEYASHQELVASYRILEDKIREQEKQQEIQLAKMADAVEAAEEAAAEAQQHRMNRDALIEELERLKSVTSTTTKEFEEAFAKHEAAMKAHYDGVLKTVKERSAILEAENSQLRHDKDSLQKQLEAATRENAILTGSKGDNGFSDFLETMSQLKSEIQVLYTKKEQLVADNEKMEMNINDIKGKLVIHASSARNEQLELNQRVQKLEMELGMHKATCKDLLENNAKLVSENQRMRNDIVQVQRASNREMQAKLKDKNRELEDVKHQLEVAQQSNTKAITDMQQAVLAFRQHADKWKCKAQSIGIEVNDAKQTAEGEQQQMVDKINDLDAQLQKRKQLKAKCELMLQQMNEQVKTLKRNVAVAEKKQRQQATAITQMINQQNAFSVEKGQHYAMLEALNAKIRRQQMAINALRKQ